MTENHTHETHQEASASEVSQHGYVPPRRAAHEQPAKKSESWGSIVSTVLILLIAPIVALLLTAFVFQSYQVDGPSMQTTLFNNDRLLVWKVPKTWSRITGHAYVPQRGDVIIFNELAVSSYSPDAGKQLIKRVIALPGEHLVIHDNAVTIYNKQYPQGYHPDQSLPYGHVIKETSGDVDMIVPQNHVFVMGDNRPDSLDSRAFGPVATSDIVGKLVVRVWPFGQMKTF